MSRFLPRFPRAPARPSLAAVATEPSLLAVIDERAFLFLVRETPMFAVQMMRSMADRIRELDALG